MELTRIKNILFIILIALNIALFSLNYIQRSKYTISTEQETALINFMSSHGISVYSKLIYDYSPMKQITVRPAVLSEKSLLGIFLGSQADQAVKSEESSKTIYTRKDETLVFDKNNIQYKNMSPKNTDFVFGDIESMKKICEPYVDALKKMGYDLTYDYQYKNQNDYYVLEYRSVYSGRKLYSAYISFRIYEKGLMQSRGYFYDFVEEKPTSREMYSCDEALFALYAKFKDVYGNVEAIINNIDVVYKADESATDISSVITASPYYRVYLNIRPEQPYLINAYTNKVE